MGMVYCLAIHLKEYRCKMLSKLVSMSVALECSTILECVAVWIMVRKCVQIKTSCFRHLEIRSI